MVEGVGGNSADFTDYFDLGSLQSWNFVDYTTNPPSLNMDMVNKYLETLEDQLKNGGVTNLTLSFAQLSDLSKIASGDLSDCDTTDSFYMIYQNTAGATTSDGQNIIQYMIGQLSQAGISTTLAFGGAGASSDDFNLGFSSSYTPEDAAKDLATIINEYHLSGIDFDLEGGATNMVQQNGADNLVEFFSALHSQVDVPITLTVMGDVNTWGINGSAFGNLFSQGTAFNQMFDGINLMLYNGQYYLDSSNQSWAIDTWINQLASQMGCSPETAASYLHIGFNDSIDYTDPNSSGGQQYNVPSGLNSGQAAAWIYSQVLDSLRQEFNDPNLSLGSPFFWDGNADYSVNPADGGQSHFMPSSNSFEQEFMSQMKLIKKG